MKTAGERRTLWFTSPLLVAVVGLLASLLAAGIGAALQGYSNTELERSKFEFTLIQKALESRDKKDAAKNLKFLVEAGIIRSLDRESLSAWLISPRGFPPTLPQAR
jgi:hypothetical protein